MNSFIIALRIIIASSFIFLATGLVYGQVRCNQAVDYLVQTREKSLPGISREELENASQLLKKAITFCPNLADAWYYRYLFSKQLGNQREAEYSLTKAKEFSSEALRRGDDPFAIPSLPSATEIRLPPVVREKWALVIGIGKFGDPKIPTLTYPAKDARDFSTALTNSYGRFKSANVRLLTDEQATTVRIKKEMDGLARDARPEDLVVVYLSSHGSSRENDRAGVNYVVTHDTEVDNLYATSLAMVELVDAVRSRIKSQRAIVFLDTCYSGAAAIALGNSSWKTISTNISPGSNQAGSKALTAEGRGISQEMLSRIGQGIGRVIITASQPHEKSWESDTLRNGIFTYYLIQGLKLNDGLASIEHVFNYLKVQVTERARSEKQASQIPAMQTSERLTKSDICLGVAPQGP